MTFNASVRNFRRRYREPVIRLLFKLFFYVPRSVAYRLGNFIGWLLWLSNGTTRNITEINLGLCLPNKDEDERRRIAKESLCSLGRAITETPFLWTASQQKILDSIVRVEGEEHIEKAMAEQRGIICLTPHLGAWEIIGLYLSIKYPMICLYSPPDMTTLENIMLKGRTRFGLKLAATDARGVRVLLTALKKGEILGILPDQDPGKVGGAFAPLFGIQANTITLVTRLVQKTNAAPLVCFAERLPNGKGYVIHFQPELTQVGGESLDVSLAEINSGIASVIREYPEQYQWGYKRFKTRPAGEAQVY